jgi:peroxiredoxin
MAAWGDATGATGKIRMLADADALLAKALGVDYDASGGLGFTRSRRWSALVEDGEFKAFNLEPPEGGLTCSLSGPMLAIL